MPTSSPRTFQFKENFLAMVNFDLQNFSHTFRKLFHPFEFFDWSEENSEMKIHFDSSSVGESWSLSFVFLWTMTIEFAFSDSSMMMLSTGLPMMLVRPPRATPGDKP